MGRTGRNLIVNRRIHVVYRYALPALIVCQIFAVQTGSIILYCG
jgi:hypothetical protein